MPILYENEDDMNSYLVHTFSVWLDINIFSALCGLLYFNLKLVSVSYHVR